MQTLSKRAGVAMIGVAIALFASGCVPLSGGWSTEVLGQLHPEIALPEGHRLGDTPPHFWPTGDRAWLFLCRFDTSDEITVALPVDAAEDEKRDLRIALEAWQGAGLGVRFRETTSPEAEIIMQFDDSRARGLAPLAGTGLTVTDCEVDRASAPESNSPGQLAAKLVRARVILRRSNPDTVGREIPLSSDQRLGAALHELGHALGFAGHIGSQDSIMTTTTERIRSIGRGVRAGEGLREPSLVALYTLPNGVVVGSASLSPAAVRDLRGASRLAQERQWQGPFVRVGQRSAQLHYRRGSAMAGRLAVADYAKQLRSDAPLGFAPTTLVRFLQSRRED